MNFFVFFLFFFLSLREKTKQMPYYRRRWRRRPRRYVRRWMKRRARRFVNGSSKSQVRLKVPVSAVRTFTIDVSQDAQGHTVVTPSDPQYICPFATIRDDASSNMSALSSPLYQAYCNLYEEVKCIGMKTQLSVSTQIGGTTLPALEIQTALDRKLARDDVSLGSKPSYAQMKTSSSFLSSVAINNSIAKLQRTCYANDLFERAAWHDCTLNIQNLNPPHNYRDETWETNSASVPFFCPGLWIAMNCPGVPAATVDVVCSIETMFYFSFRNPKWGSAVTAQRMRVDPANPIDYGDMDSRGPAGGADVDMDRDEDPEGDIFEQFAADVGQKMVESTVPRQAKSAKLMDAAHRKQHAATKAIVLTPPSKKNL